MVPRDSLGAIGRTDFAGAHAAAAADGRLEQPHHSRLAQWQQTPHSTGAPARVTALREYAGRDHFVIGEPGWDEVAEFVADWLDKSVR